MSAEADMVSGRGQQALAQRLRDKSARVGVVGLGYVGLPLAVELCRAGYHVTGIEVDPERVAALRQGRSYVSDVSNAALAACLAEQRLDITSDFSAVSSLDALSICVPTPLRKSKDPDVSYIKVAVEQIAPFLETPSVVVLESTTYPGTTDEVVAPALSRAGRVIGEDLFVAFSPERVDPGNPQWHTRNIPKVIGGVTPACTRMAELFYESAIDHLITVGSAREAEMVKLLENTFRAVNIALVNEMLLMCDRMGIDIWRVVDAAATKPFGFMPFYPGPGIGGHCIPSDPVYLSWKAKTFDFFNRFIELATDINGNMPRFVVHKLMHLLNDRSQCLNGARILVVGLAYKPGVSDTRDSPGIEIFKLLQATGAVVSYHDDRVAQIDIEGTPHASVALSPTVLAEHAAVVIVTAHPELDRPLLARHAALVLDTRHAMHDIAAPHVVKL